MDLDDINGNVSHGVHVAAMAGSWVSLVYGFAGLRDDDGAIAFSPRLPEAWDRLAFRLLVGGTTLAVTITRHAVRYEAESGDGLDIRHFGQPVSVRPGVAGRDRPRPGAPGRDLRPRRRHHRHRRAPLPGVAAPRGGGVAARSTASSTSGSRASAGWRASTSSSRTRARPRACADKARLADRKNAYFRELIDQITPGRPPAGDRRAARRSCGRAAIRTAIASMSQNVYDVVRHLGIEEAVDAIVDPATLVKGKPDPEIFLVGGGAARRPVRGLRGDRGRAGRGPRDQGGAHGRRRRRPRPPGRGLAGRGHAVPDR